MPSPVASHVRRLVALAVPVTVAQLGSMLLMVIDLIMLGRVGVDALDAASLGRVWVMGTVIFAMGLLFGIDPIASHAHGAGERERLEGALGQGLVLAAAVSLPLAASGSPPSRSCAVSARLRRSPRRGSLRHRADPRRRAFCSASRWSSSIYRRRGSSGPGCGSHYSPTVSTRGSTGC